MSKVKQSPKEDQAQPTRGGLAVLLNKLRKRRWNFVTGNPELQKLRESLEAIEKYWQSQMESDSTYKKLKKQRDALYDALHARDEAFHLRVQKVYKRFLAHGATPAVVKEIQALVEDQLDSHNDD